MKNTILITAILLIVISATATAYDMNLASCLFGRSDATINLTGTTERYFNRPITGTAILYMLCSYPGNYSFFIDSSGTQILYPYELNEETGALVQGASCGSTSESRAINNLSCTSSIGLFGLSVGGGLADNIYYLNSGYNITVNYSRNFPAGTQAYLPYTNFFLTLGDIVYSSGDKLFKENITTVGVGTFLTTIPNNVNDGYSDFIIWNYNKSNYNAGANVVMYHVKTFSCNTPSIVATSPNQSFNPIAGINNDFRAVVDNSDTIIKTTWRINGEDTIIDGYMPFKSILFDSPGQVEVEVIYDTSCGTFVSYTWSGFCGNYLSVEGYVYEELPDLSKSYIPNTRVVYRNVGDNTTYTGISDLSGYYKIDHFTPGLYNISVSEEGYNYFNILKNITYNYTTKVRQDIKLNSTYSWAEYLFTIDEITNTATGTFNPIETFNLTVYNEVGNPVFSWIDDTANNYSNTATFVYKTGNQISLLLDRYYTYTFNFSVSGYRCWLENSGTCSLTETIEYDSLWNMVFINDSNLATASNITITFKDTNNTAINRAMITMYYNGNNTVFGTGLTDSNGQISFLNIPEAQYYWTLSAENFSAWKSEPKTIYKNENLTFTLKRIVQDYAIYGKITACAVPGTTTASPLANVVLNFTQGEISFIGSSDLNGDYRVKVKKSNNPYYLRAGKEGYGSLIDNDYYADLGGIEQKYDFCLIKLAGYNLIEIDVRENNGTHILAVSNATINVFKDGTIYDTGNTNFYGKISFSLPTGSYKFTALKEGYYPEVYPIDQEEIYLKTDQVITINMQQRGILDDLKDIGIPTNEKEFTKFIDSWGIAILILLILVMAFSSMVIMVKKTGII